MPMRPETRTGFQRLSIVFGLFLAGGLVVLMIFRKDGYSVEPDGRMIFHRNRPFSLKFHRGGDYNPSHSISVNEGGWVTVRLQPWFEPPDPSDVKAVFQLSPDGIRAVAKSIIHHDLMRLRKNYDFEYISHADSWSITLQQGSRLKESTFRHIFPRAIKDFAHDLDDILDAAAFQGEPRPRMDQLIDDVPDRYVSAPGRFP